MLNYIIRRLAQAIPQLFLISIVLFMLMQAFGDPIASLGVRTPPRPADRERLRRQLGLDQPLYIQYLSWLIGNDWMKIDMDGDGVPETPGKRLGVLRGDFGNSLISKRPALELITERLPNTLLLMITVEVVIIIFSLMIGVYSAFKQYSFFDNFVTGLSFVGYSIPIPLIALLLMYFFSVNFKNWGLPYLPTVGMFDPQVGRTPGQIALHMILPVLSLSIISIAGYSRYVRSSMLEVLGLDYIRTARAKGLRERIVVMKHALRNATLPFVTLIGLDIPFLFAGAVVTESIFAWPGTGRLFVERTAQSDFPVLMGILMMIGVAVVIFQLITDITYSFLDPRIRIE
ncbi:MAG TPA: ABC transporter permease [Anaerolineales bacterium]|jgi:peptide/nickel transport system permease protein|nr:ABC transporter permease [Anaerolineales bacterium]